VSRTYASRTPSLSLTHEVRGVIAKIYVCAAAAAAIYILH